jgi:hypothetical protein
MSRYVWKCDGCGALGEIDTPMNLFKLDTPRYHPVHPHLPRYEARLCSECANQLFHNTPVILWGEKGQMIKLGDVKDDRRDRKKSNQASE